MTRRLAAPALLGLAAAGSLVGCASPGPVTEVPLVEVTASPTGPETVTTVPRATTTPAAEQEQVTASTVYEDGTYSASGQYIAPSGPESVDVTVTIAADVVTSVTVVGHAGDRTAQRHQADFIGGVGELVVGQPLSGLSVSRVAGSSLTSGGFNAALDVIRSEAQQ